MEIMNNASMENSNQFSYVEIKKGIKIYITSVFNLRDMNTGTTSSTFIRAISTFKQFNLNSSL